MSILYFLRLLTDEASTKQVLILRFFLMHKEGIPYQTITNNHLLPQNRAKQYILVAGYMSIMRQSLWEQNIIF